MRFTIRNDEISIPFDLPASTSIARVKAMYVASGRATGSNEHICFKLDGKLIADHKTLRSAGVRETSIITHRPVLGSYAPVDYEKLAEALERSRDPSHPHFDSKEREWTHGREWEQFPPVLVGDIWEEPHQRETLSKCVLNMCCIF